MKKYTVTIPIKKAVGHQAFDIEASSAEEAIAKVKAGGGVYNEDFSEIEVADVDYDDMSVNEL